MVLNMLQQQAIAGVSVFEVRGGGGKMCLGRGTDADLDWILYTVLLLAACYSGEGGLEQEPEHAVGGEQCETAA